MKCVKETYNQLFWQVTTRWLHRNVILSLGLWRPQLWLTVAGCDYFYHSEMYIRIQRMHWDPYAEYASMFYISISMVRKCRVFFFEMKNVTNLTFLLTPASSSVKIWHRPNLFTFYPKLAQIQQLNHDWKWPFFALTRNPWLKLTYVNEFLNLLLIQNLTDVQAVGAFSSVLELEILILLVRLSFRLLHTSPTTGRCV